MRSHRTPALLGAALLALPLLAACGGGAKSTDGAADGKVAVNATDTACEVATTEFQPGDVTFAVHNKGSRATEVYVYGEQKGTFTKVVTEVENIGPGTSRDMSVKLAPGTYEVACKPGQTGDGIRKRITVAGGSPSATAPASPSASPSASAAVSAQPTASATGAPDREIEVEAKEYELEFEGMDKLSAKVGERIAFTLENKGSVAHDLQIFAPDGTKVGEIAAVGPGGKDEGVVTLSQPGTYTIKCGIGSHAEHGMTTTFTVS